MNFLIRTITAVIYAFVLLFCMQRGDAWFISLFAVCTLLSTIEFIGLANKYKKADASVVWSSLAATAAFLTIAFGVTKTGNVALLALFMVILLVLFVSELFLKKESPMRTLAFSLFPILYISLPYGILTDLAFNDNGVYHPAIPVALFIMLWCNDVGAYCTGCTIGKHKLFERVSPKKTWEGSIGGAVLTIVGAIVLCKSLPRIFDGYSLGIWVGMALIVVVFGTLGDLFESLMKREMGIKDSGKILPGHGGMLDRFDSAMLAIPAILVYFNVIFMIMGS